MPPRDEQFAGPVLNWFVSMIFGVFQFIGRRQDVQQAEHRSGESICSFARSFDCCAIDTWIIRGVYEEFSWSYPIRPEDSFREDLHIDDEDYEDSVVAIAERIGRSLEDMENNPMNGKIKTVRDLVLFLQYQPKVA